ncbi:BCCT family transporter, partial [Bacillus sp. S34]|nr:BCCT family transporter [Bacillus sp. S34]
PPLYVQGLSVSAKSKHIATAEALAACMTNAKNQEAFAHLVNIFPSTTSSQSDPYFSKDDGTVEAKARVLANDALKTAAITTALPFSIVMVLMCWSTVVAFTRERRAYVRAERRALMTDLAEFY